MGRKPKLDIGQVVTWRSRGYNKYGVVVTRRALTKRMAYTIALTDPFGAWDEAATIKTVNKWAHQVEEVLTNQGNPRMAPRTVAAYNKGRRL